MGILATYLSQADMESGHISTTAGKFDTEITDFAWWSPNEFSVGDRWNFPHNEATGDDTWYHFGIIVDAFDGGDDGHLGWLLDAAANQICKLRLIDGKLQVEAIGTTTVVSTPTVTVPATLARWDLHVDRAGAGMTITLYENGSGTALATATITDTGTFGTPAMFQMAHLDHDDAYFSELYMADFDTRDTRPIRQNVNAVGNHTAWDGAFGNVSDESIMTSIKEATATGKESYNVETYAGPATLAGISRVAIKLRASKGASGPSNINPLVRIGGTDYSAGNIGPTTTPLIYFAEFLQNPDTSVDWVKADLDTTEIGVEAIT